MSMFFFLLKSTYYLLLFNLSSLDCLLNYKLTAARLGGWVRGGVFEFCRWGLSGFNWSCHFIHFFGLEFTLRCDMMKPNTCSLPPLYLLDFCPQPISTSTIAMASRQKTTKCEENKLLNVNCLFVIYHLLLKSHVSYGSIYFKPPGNIAELYWSSRFYVGFVALD